MDYPLGIHQSHIKYLDFSSTDFLSVVDYLFDIYKDDIYKDITTKNDNYIY